MTRGKFKCGARFGAAGEMGKKKPFPKEGLKIGCRDWI